MKNIVLRIAILVGLFVCFFLLWPDFRVESSCAPASAGGEGCALRNEYIFSDYEIGGGLRLVEQQQFCLIWACNDETYETISSDEQRYPAYAVPGSIVLTLFVCLLLFLPSRKKYSK